MRKRISGTRIEEISMLGTDRIVIFKLAGKVPMNMIIEMFGMGNLIIADQSMKVELAYRHASASGRKIIPKEQYAEPKPPMHEQPYPLPPFYMEEARRKRVLQACRRPSTSHTAMQGRRRQ